MATITTFYHVNRLYSNDDQTAEATAVKSYLHPTQGWIACDLDGTVQSVILQLNEMGVTMVQLTVSIKCIESGYITKRHADYSMQEITTESDDAVEIAKQTGKKVETDATLTRYDRKGDIHMEDVHPVTVHPDGKVTVHHLMADWRDRKQKLKDGAHGEYVIFFKTRAYIELHAA